MAGALILLLPPATEAGGIARWWTVADGAVADSGEGEPGESVDAATVIALVPAMDAPVHWLHLPGLTAPQAAAAARLAVAEKLLGAAADQHVAAGMATAGGLVPCAAVSRAGMQRWLALLDEAGFGEAVLVPVAALVVPPGEGAALRAELPGGAVFAAAGLSAAADHQIDALRWTGGDALTLTDKDSAERIAALAAQVPLDLRSGEYAPRRGAEITPAMRRWFVRLAAALLLLTLAQPLMQAWQWSRASAAADARALAAAGKAQVRASDAVAAEAELDRRLAARGGGPLSLSAPLGGLYRALQAEPAVALRSLAHSADGTATVTLAAPRIEDVNDVLKALQVAGFTITAQPMSGSDGMQMATVTVRALP